MSNEIFGDCAPISLIKELGIQTFCTYSADLTFKVRFCLGICQSRKRHLPEQSNGMAKPQDHLKKKETGRILFHRKAAAAGSLRTPEPFPIVLLR